MAFQAFHFRFAMVVIADIRIESASGSLSYNTNDFGRTAWTVHVSFSGEPPARLRELKSSGEIVTVQLDDGHISGEAYVEKLTWERHPYVESVGVITEVRMTGLRALQGWPRWNGPHDRPLSQ